MICKYNIPILSIFRGIKESEIEPVIEILINCGLGCAEITMNTPNAGKLIDKFISIGGSKLAVGAGTVLTMSDLAEALDAGASFIVMPNINFDILEYCAKNNIDVFPGALTPTEVTNAWNAGATMVKVFPASAFGPKYIKELKAPLDKIKLIAVGGVNKDTIGEFFINGADAVAIGASVFKRDLLDKGQFAQIEANLKELINNYIQSKKK